MAAKQNARLLRLLWTAPMALGVCYFALWACAPVHTMPSSAPLAPGMHHQLGVGGGTAINVPPVSHCTVFGTDECAGPQLQAWYRHAYDQTDLAVVVHGGKRSIGGAGVTLNHYLLQTDTFRMGVGGGIGWLWADIGMPISGRITNGVWLYSRPSAVLAANAGVLVPLGLTIGAKRTSFNIETGMNIGNLDRYPLIGVGVGFAF